MKYTFKCNNCKKKKEIEVRVSEYYIPECCKKEMIRVYEASTYTEGKLR